MIKRLFGVVVILTLVLGERSALADTPSPPFQPATQGTAIELPRDHGAHPEYETEWWYYTGHLVPAGADIFTSAERYGFQLTFFRRGAVGSDKNTQQIFLAHAALTEVQTGTFIADSRIGAEVLGFASAAPARLDVRHLDWSAEQVGPLHSLRFSLPSLSPTHELRLIGPEAPPLVHGDRGFSRKGACATCASMYYSVPRIPVRGHIITPSGVREVHGLAWMDHEYMTNALAPDEVGWDWTALTFRDGTDLMVFRIRSRDGGVATLSGTVRREGRTTPLERGDIVFEPVGERWRSPTTGGEYPLRFRLEVPRFGIKTEIGSVSPNQEVGSKSESGIAYYEGAVKSIDDTAIGYLEMTGYAGSVGDRL